MGEPSIQRVSWEVPRRLSTLLPAQLCVKTYDSPIIWQYRRVIPQKYLLERIISNPLLPKLPKAQLVWKLYLLIVWITCCSLILSIRAPHWGATSGLSICGDVVPPNLWPAVSSFPCFPKHTTQKSLYVHVPHRKKHWLSFLKAWTMCIIISWGWLCYMKIFYPRYTRSYKIMFFRGGGFEEGLGICIFDKLQSWMVVH